EPLIGEAARDLTERLDLHHAHGRPSPGTESVQRDPVPQVVDGIDEGGGRLPLFLVGALPACGCLGHRTRDVQQHEDGQTAAPSLAVQVDALVETAAGHRLHLRLHDGVDFDVVSLELAATPLQPYPEAAEPLLQACGRWWYHRPPTMGNDL